MYNNFEAEARSEKMKFAQTFLRESVQSGFFSRSTPRENPTVSHVVYIR